MSSSLVEFSNSIADAVEKVGTSVIAVLEGGREGVSGTLWREDLAVTAEHTIRGRNEVTVVLPNGEESKANVAGRDAGTDIAVLTIAQKFGGASLADDSQARVGEIVLSVGRRGMDGLATTYGVISALGGPWRTWQGARIDRLLRLDLNPFTGFSGGPIVNARGEVLGIATSGPRRSVVTIPTSTVTRIVDQLLKRGHVARGYLGVGMQSVAFPDSARQTVGMNAERGLLVVTVAQGSSAEQSGVLLGDIIVSVNGSPVHSLRSLQPLLDSENVGNQVHFEIVRGGKLVKLSVTVGERPGS
jgi:S1-C subfamily serine protease